MTGRTAAVPGLLMGVGAALLLGINRQRPVPLRASLETLPKEIAGFTGVTRKLEPKEQQVAGMQEYVFRDYGSAFSVYAAYYDQQTRGRTIHTPRNCLPGAGWEPIAVSDHSVPVDGRPIQVRRYLLGKGSRRALVYYWYQGRGRVTGDEYRVKWELLRDAVLRGRTEEALVRVVVPLSGPAAEPRGDALASQVVPAVIHAMDRTLPIF